MRIQVVNGIYNIFFIKYICCTYFYKYLRTNYIYLRYMILEKNEYFEYIFYLNEYI